MVVGLEVNCGDCAHLPLLMGACFTDLRQQYALFRFNFCKSSLADARYWDAAYATGRYAERYEWLQTGSELWPHMEKQLDGKPDAVVLHVGCGNSTLGCFLSDKGYDVVNFDVSPAVIEMMRKQRPDLKWVCADCAVEGSLGEPEACDYVLDKGGIDALLEAETENARSQARCMVKEVFRVLRRGGCYQIFSISPANRLFFSEFFNVHCETIEGFSCDLYQKLVFVYTCTK